MDSSKAFRNYLSIKTSIIFTIVAYTTSTVSTVTSQPTRIVLPNESAPPTVDQLVGPSGEYQPQQPPPSISSQNPNQHQYALYKSEPFMQLHELSETSTTGNNITCNDGTPIGYYKRLNRHSKSWIIYLQGGGFCGSEESCQQRWQRSPHLMSSNFWPKNKTVDGILSHEPKDNPFLWNANHIYVPYCSSDSWTGLAPAAVTNQGANLRMYDNKESSADSRNRKQVSTFSFMGSKIIERILESLYEDLPKDSSLYSARYILFAGDSAGATGVILNLDKVDQFIEQKYEESRLRCAFQVEQSNCYSIQRPVLRGLSDSGWFLDNEPYDFFDHNTDQITDYSPPSTANDQQLKIKHRERQQYWQQYQNDNTDIDCDKQQCTPLQSIRRAMIHWNGQVPQDCFNQYANEPWRCYFGYRAYKSLKTPLFVVQWLYDEAQLMFDNIGHPDTSGQWDYVKKVVNQMKSSLENVTALFAPSCFSHSLVTRQSWNQININGIKLPYVLNHWEEQAMLDSARSFAIRIQAGKRPTDVINPDQSGRIVSYSERPSITIDQSEPHQPSMNNPLQAPSRDENDRIIQSHSHVELRRASHHRSVSGAARSRGRKKKRNNSSQQHRSRQLSRPKASVNLNDNTNGNNYNQALQANREFNDWNSFQSNSPQMPEMQTYNNDDVILTNRNRTTVTNMNRSGIIADNSQPNIRPGRSTIYDEVGWSMNSNSVPDDANSADNKPTMGRAEPTVSPSIQMNSFGDTLIPSSGGIQDSNGFRLIDICGWPQCNRDCPIIDQIGVNLDPP